MLLYSIHQHIPGTVPDHPMGALSTYPVGTVIWMTSKYSNPLQTMMKIAQKPIMVELFMSVVHMMY